MRVLFTVFSDSGHLNPMLAVAQWLQRRGHETMFFSCQADISERCRRAGLQGRCVVDRSHAGGLAPSAPPPTQLIERMANPAWLKRWLWAVLVAPVAQQLGVLRTLIREQRPQVIATDAMAYVGAVAATLEGVPWAALSTGLQSFGHDGPSAAAFEHLARPRAAHIAAMGVELGFRSSDCISPALNLVFATPRLWHGSETPAGVVAVGAALPPEDGRDDASFPWQRIPGGRSLVYVAFGSQVSPAIETYEALAASLHADEAFFVMAVKDLLDAPRIRALPDHVLTVGYAPQLQLLRRASIMVNHGGTNSVMECLSIGTPMIVVPLTNDQFLMARLVERSGLGTVLATPLTPTSCREAILRILSTDRAVRTPASRTHSGADGAGGAETAAELLLGLAR